MSGTRLRWRLGLDDTDTLDGGCTTDVLHRLLVALAAPSDTGRAPPWRIVSWPRLVRLWPHAPHRTRGNAAVAALIDLAAADAEALVARVGTVAERLLPGLERLDAAGVRALRAPGRPAAPDGDAPGRRPATPARPGLVLGPAPDEGHYWGAVRGPVGLEALTPEVASWLEAGTHAVWGAGGAVGLIGAVAAIAWSPGPTATWEHIAWRAADRIGEPRAVDPGVVAGLETHHPQVMLSRDPVQQRTLLAPRAPCPVLWGIRARRPAAATAAHAELKASGGEVPVASRTFLTNQATGDHLRGIRRGLLTADPRIGRRGHTSLEVTDDVGAAVRLLAFTEGGALNALARELRNGDRIAWQGLTHPSGAVHLERLRLLRPVTRPTTRPACPACGRRLESAGRGQPLRCRTCRTHHPRRWRQAAPPRGDGWMGWSEPSPGARRHLAAPLPEIGTFRT